MGGGNYVPDYRAFNDVWSTEDGKEWKCETEAAGWNPRLWFSSATYRNHLWVLGGWSNNPSKNWGDAWYSADGKIGRNGAPSQLGRNATNIRPSCCTISSGSLEGTRTAEAMRFGRWNYRKIGRRQSNAITRLIPRLRPPARSDRLAVRQSSNLYVTPVPAVVWIRMHSGLARGATLGRSSW